MNIIKRDRTRQPLDINKIKTPCATATKDISGVSQSELELDAGLKFIDDMESAAIQEALITTAVEKIDIDVPNWTFVAARLLMSDIRHRVGKRLGSVKGERYPTLKKYVDFGIGRGKIISSLAKGYDLDKLNSAIDIDRDELFTYLGARTLADRYLLKDSDGEYIELPQLMFMGIAMFLAQKSKNKTEKAIEFYNVISKFEVMLATPTLSNARTTRHQLSSCYIGSSPDNIEGIFDGYKEMGLLSKFGGGIGWDWHNVRALGGVIADTVSAAGGIVPFLKINNDIALAVDQLGTRKGAIAVYVEPWHADILDFIDLKKNSGEERRRAHDIFPSLWMNDLFMETINEDGDWYLMDPHEVPELHSLFGDEFKVKYMEAVANPKIGKTTIKAKELWKKILTSYFESGSPFLCHKDIANKANPNDHDGIIYSSNLCTEIFQNTEPDNYVVEIELVNGHTIRCEEDDVIKLIDGETKVAKHVTSIDILEDGSEIYMTTKVRIAGKTAVCNLASVNLSKINTKVDFERVIPTAVEMLDNVIDLNFYPLKKVKDSNMRTRAIGLGVMGEAHMLALQGIRWGSQEHFEKVDTIMEMFSYNAIKSSMELSKVRGSYPAFDGSKWSKGIMPIDHANDAVRALTTTDVVYDWSTLREDVKEHGIRNGYLMAIAPTSSISILVGTSQAIEPIYKRKWFEENLSGLIPVTAPDLNADTWNNYVPAYEVEQLDLVRAAGIRQKWLDQGQSTNIFMDLKKASGKYLNDVYMLSWSLGCKSNYYLRGESPEAVADVADRSQECVGCQ